MVKTSAVAAKKSSPHDRHAPAAVSASGWNRGFASGFALVPRTAVYVHCDWVATDELSVVDCVPIDAVAGSAGGLAAAGGSENMDRTERSDLSGVRG